MPITLNNASVDANGYVNGQAVEDGQDEGQVAASANVAGSSAAQAKQMVAQVANGDAVSGSTLSGVGAPAATGGAPGSILSSSVPNLPYQQVAKADAPTGQQISSTIAEMNVSSVTAYRILQQAGQKSYELDSTISRTANKAVTTAKLQQVTDLKAQIDGERKSAQTQLWGSLAAAVAGIAMGVTGNLMRGASATKNDAIDTEKALKGINTKTSTMGDDKINEFAARYRAARKEILDREANARAAGINNKRDDQLRFDDVSYKEFAAYKEQKRLTTSHLPGADEKDLDLKAGKQWFAERGDGKLFPGSGLPGATFLQRIMHHDSGKSSIGAGIDGGAQGVTQAVSSFFQVIDTLHGGKYDADQAKLAQKQDEVQVSLAQQVADQAKSNRDRDQKQVSDNLDAIKEVATRYASVIDKLT